MAISTCLVLPRIIPAYSSFLYRNKAHKNYSNVAFTRSCKTWSPIPSTRPKANPTVIEMLSAISEKDEGEIQADINRIQHAFEKLRGSLRDTILVLMATNPILLLLCDIMVSDSRFIRWSSIGASYGALVLLKECAKVVLWKSQPIWAFIIVGYLIYKTNRRNIALHRKGRYPVWLGKPLAGLFLGKFLADCFLLLKIPERLLLDFTLAFIDIVASCAMFVCFLDDDILVG